MDEDGAALGEAELLDLAKEELVRQLIKQRDRATELDAELDDASREKEEAEERLNDRIEELRTDLDEARSASGSAAGGGGRDGGSDGGERGRRGGSGGDDRAVMELRELIAKEKEKSQMLRSGFRKTKQQLRDARDSEDLVKTELRGAEEDVKTARAELRALERRTQDDLSKSTRAVGTMRTMRAAQADLNQTILDLTARGTSQDSEVAALREEVQTLRDAQAVWEEAEMELRTQLGDAQDGHEDAGRQMDGLNDDLEELTRAKQDSLARIAELEAALEDTREAKVEEALASGAAIKALEEQAAALQTQIGDERETFQTGKMHAELDELREENGKLSETFARTTHATESARAQLADATQRIFTLEEDMEGEVEMKTAAIRRGMVALERERDQMAELVENAERHNQGLMLKMNEVQEEVDEATRWRAAFEQGNGLEQYRREHDEMAEKMRTNSAEVQSTRVKMNGLLGQVRRAISIVDRRDNNTYVVQGVRLTL